MKPPQREGLRVVVEVHGPGLSSLRQVLEDRAHVVRRGPELRHELAGRLRRVEQALGGPGVEKEAVRPGRAGHRREPVIAHDELARQGGENGHEGRIEALHDAAPAVTQAAAAGVGLLRVVQDEPRIAGSARIRRRPVGEQLLVDVLEVVAGTGVGDVRARRRDPCHRHRRHVGRRGHGVRLRSREAFELLRAVGEIEIPEEPVERLVLEHQDHEMSDLIHRAHGRRRSP